MHSPTGVASLGGALGDVSLHANVEDTGQGAELLLKGHFQSPVARGWGWGWGMAPKDTPRIGRIYKILRRA